MAMGELEKRKGGKNDGKQKDQMSKGQNFGISLN
jgi:hypothetical protein